MEYLIHKTSKVPLFSWNHFDGAENGVLNNIGGPETDHPPQTMFRLLHDKRNIYGIFEVREIGVLAKQTAFQSMVCMDSCCEFFFQPSGKDGYFNLEMNAGGTFLMYYIRDPKPDPGSGLPSDYTPLSIREGNFITVKTDLPHYIPEPVMKETLWHLMFTIPLEALEPYCGRIESLDGQIWRGNFYKCSDGTQWPGWLTWADLDSSSFHEPESFQKLIFA